MRTTSPIPVYRSTRDTRNSALWNPTSRELLNVEDDESGRLASFRARFGTSFDNQKTIKKTDHATPPPAPADIAIPEGGAQAPSTNEPTRELMFEEEQNLFEEDDANMLDFISSFGQQNSQQSQTPSAKKGGKK
jgi:hypothetical protein